MQFRLFSFALIILNCMEYSNCQAPSHRWRRTKRGKRMCPCTKAWGKFVAKVTPTRARTYTLNKVVRSCVEVPKEPGAREMCGSPYC